MLFQVLADATVLAHVAFVAFVVVGGLLAARWPRAAWVHLPAAAWGAWVEFAGWICPLTPLENWLRQRAGETGYASGFVEHHLMPLLYPSLLTRDLQVGLGTLVLLVNAGVYAAVWRAHARLASKPGGETAQRVSNPLPESKAGEGKLVEPDLWAVWRQDDTGNQYCIRHGLSAQEARALVASLEGRGHKQTYWAKREAS